MRKLPRIMVAPNGARRGKQDHPALPVTIAETVETVVACQAAGADGAHLHVRASDGAHVLDAGLYRELLAELDVKAPDVFAQVTTEAVGMYSSVQQRDLVTELRPDNVSIALREIRDDADDAELQSFFHWAGEAGIAVQHILFAPEEVSDLAGWVERKVVPDGGLQALFVLGRYTAGQRSSPEDLDPFLDEMRKSGLDPDWAICAFGQRETDCLVRAAEAGGKVRIGFENNLHNRDGGLAADNADRVRELVAALGS